MKFISTKLAGAFIIEPEPHEDERGFFARTVCAREFEERGLVWNFVQSSISFNRLKGTLRGLHYQLPPACEVKLARCTAGAVYDVIVDLRPDSPTFMQHLSVELTSENRRALYVPKMFAQGFQTLKENTELLYQIGEFYTPEAATGVRHDDPKLGIKWPLPVTTITDKDLRWPLL